MNERPNVVPREEPLDDLARRINATHGRAEESLRRGLALAREAGQLLLEAKSRVKHGGWLPWLKANVRFSARTAQAYMRVAGSWEEIQAKAQDVALLNYRDALDLLVEAAAPPPEDPPPLDGVTVNGRFFRTPFARLLPDIQGTEWEQFLGSVRDRGIHKPVIVDEEDNVIDGRQRLRAAAVLGLPEVPLEVRAGLSFQDQLDLWESYNIVRAHYTPDQIAMSHAIEKQILAEHAAAGRSK